MVDKEQYGKSPLSEILPTLKQYNELIKKRIDYEAMAKEIVMAKEIFGLIGFNYDKKYTRWTRFRWRIRAFFERFRDAWGVLTGNRRDYD